MKYLVLGSKGQLAKEFIHNLNKLNLPFEAYDLDKLDISDYQQLNYYISKIKPDIVLNCASFNDTVASEENPTILLTFQFLIRPILNFQYTN